MLFLYRVCLEIEKKLISETYFVIHSLFLLPLLNNGPLKLN